MPVVKHGDKYGIGRGDAIYDDPKTAWRAYYGYMKRKYGSISKAKRSGELKDKKDGTR